MSPKLLEEVKSYIYMFFYIYCYFVYLYLLLYFGFDYVLALPIFVKFFIIFILFYFIRGVSTLNNEDKNLKVII